MFYGCSENEIAPTKNSSVEDNLYELCHDYLNVPVSNSWLHPDGCSLG